MNRFRALVISASSEFDLVERGELVKVNADGLHNQETLTNLVLQRRMSTSSIYIYIYILIYDIVLSAS